VKNHAVRIGWHLGCRKESSDVMTITRINVYLEKLLDLLEEEAGLFQVLLTALQKEKRAVVDSKLAQLNETSKEKENLILKIRIMEEHRRRLLEKLADSVGVSVESLTLKKISQMVGSLYSNRLMECHSKLWALTHSIQEVNQSNRSLLMHSIQLVKGSLSLLDNLLASGPVYYPTGEIKMGHRSGKFLSGRV